MNAPQLVDFGVVPPEIDRLLQAGVLAYRTDRAAADGLFRRALETAPDELPVYLCLYKIHAYQNHFEEALAIASAGLQAAARQAGWSEDFRRWAPPPPPVEGPARFALYTLKALAFIRLRMGDGAAALEILQHLAALDPRASVGWNVIADLARGAA
jgi:hypothetical protein